MSSPSVSQASPPPVLSPDCVTFSRHAVSRALDMNVDSLEIQSALFDPAIVHFSAKHSSWNFISGRVCCGVYVDSKGLATVLTVLWRNREDWKRDVELGGYKDREYRG